MQRNTIKAALTIALLLCAGHLQSQEVPAAAPAKAEVEKIVREYILQHPEVLLESVRGHQEREARETKRRSQETVAAHRRELFEDATSPVVGTPGADVTIVEFFDYRCGYCRRVSPTLSKVLAEHKNVKIIFKELPILGPESHLASLAALAAAKQGAYLAFHQELMKLNGPVKPATIEELGEKLGLDVAKLKTDMNSKEIDATLLQNQRLASTLNIQSTPSFVIGSELLPGAMDLAAFEEQISKNSHR